MPGVLWVINSQNKICWDGKFNKLDWGQALHSIHLKEFELKEIDEYLTYSKVDKYSIREKIKAASNGHPFYLYLSICTYNEIKITREPKESDFGKNYNEIYEQFMKSIAENESFILSLLSHLNYWDNDLIEILLDEFSPDKQLNKLYTYSFINQGDNHTSLHPLIKSHIIGSPANKKTLKRLHKTCAKYYKSKLTNANGDLIYENVHDLPELIYHRILHKSKENTFSKYQGYFNKLGHPVLNNYLYNSLIQFEPSISEKGNELIDADYFELLASSLNMFGYYRDSYELMKEALIIREKLKNPDLVMASTYLSIGISAQNNGHYIESNLYLEKGIRIEGINNEVLINIKLARSKNLLLQGNYSESLEELNTLLKIKDVESDSVVYTKILIRKGRILESMEKYRDAIKSYEKAEKIINKTNLILLAEIYFHLSTSYLGIANLRIAESYTDKSNELAEKLYGKIHPNLAQICSNRAMLLVKKDMHEDAIALMRSGVYMSLKFHGTNNNMTIAFYNNLAANYKFLGKKKDALRYFNIALDACKETESTQRVKILIYGHLGDFFCDNTEIKTGVNYYYLAIKETIAKYGYSHHYTKKYLNKICDQYITARVSLQELQNQFVALNLIQIANKLDVVSQYSIKEKLALIEMKFQNLRSAKALYEDLLQNSMELDPKKKANFMSNLASFAALDGKYSDAINHYLKVIELLNHNPFDTQLFITYSSLGHAYFEFQDKLNSRKYFELAQELAAELNIQNEITKKVKFMLTILSDK